ncbi:MAG TPA: LysE family transporter, partial [Thermoanaerobaculia bacterium]|nr:LysE family transporter [Thermoanaerobaculia bacterium]
LIGIRMIFWPAPAAEAAPEAESRSFMQGLVTQLANPKAIVFFTALLPQFVNPHGPIALQLLVLGIISIAIEFPVLAMYGFAADRGRALYGRHARVVERAAGGCLVIAGAKLAAQ